MNKKQLILLVVLVSFLSATASLLGYKFFFEPQTYQGVKAASPKVQFSNFIDKTKTVVPEGLNFVYAAKSVTPAVVHIKTYYEVSEAMNRGRNANPYDQFFKDFFGDQYHQYREAPQDQGDSEQHPDLKEDRPQASGSGVILSADGYIVTNNHVIDKADKIEVILDDKRTYTAKLVGTDPTTDIAVLKIEEAGLPYVPFGNSDNLQIGEWVLAVGNPFNLTSTVTAGIVSAKARNINLLHVKNNMAVESFIQTDAAVNPGNSGGALVNLNGELVGINTAIATSTGSYSGYSFAVPSTLVKKVVADLEAYGAVQRALLGVTIQDVTSQLAKEKNIDKIRGVYVASVRANSAAEKAGLQEGDLITQINDVQVSSSSQLQEQVARFRPGDKIKVTFIREGAAKSVSAVLQNKLGNLTIIKKEDLAKAVALGAQFQKADAATLKDLRLRNGVEVVNITSGKLKDAGIKEGFIITSIDKQSVNSPDEVTQLLQAKKGAILIEGFYPNGKKDYFAIG